MVDLIRVIIRHSESIINAYSPSHITVAMWEEKVHIYDTTGALNNFPLIQRC